MPPSHRRALDDIARCRTAALGGHLFRCERCGREHWQYHSCRNRACPQCHRRDRERWLAARREELLPVPCFHVIFTVPHEVGDIVRRHRKALYGALPRAAATSLIDLARDPRHVGATVGVLAVLHTWGRTLAWHPHVHCLATGGGLSDDGEPWLPARHGYLVPVRALSRRTMRLTPEEFLRRFLQHIPPPNAHVVRYYGLWAPGHRERFRRAQIVLSAELLEPVPPLRSRKRRRSASGGRPIPNGGPMPLLRQPLPHSSAQPPGGTPRPALTVSHRQLPTMTPHPKAPRRPSPTANRPACPSRTPELPFSA